MPQSCSLCVASGTAAVTASAGDMHWDEAVWFPGAQMTRVICRQAFKCHLGEEMHLENDTVGTTELYVLCSSPLRVAFLGLLRRAGPTHQAVLEP